MIRCIVCDRNLRQRKKIIEDCEFYFQKKNITYVIEGYGCGEDLLTSGCPDILIMNVRLPGISGIKTKEVLELMPGTPKIIFISDDKRILGGAFGRNVYGYITDILNRDLFYGILERIIHDITEEESYVFLKCDGYYRQVFFKDIICVESRGRGSVISIKHKNEEFRSAKGLAYWKRLLENHSHKSCNRYHLVNIHAIVQIHDALEGRGKEVELSNGRRILLSDAYANAVETSFSVLPRKYMN